MKVSTLFLSIALASSASLSSATTKKEEDWTPCDPVKCDKREHAPVDLDTYYLPTVDLTGDTLKIELNKIIRNHYRYSYSPCVWAALEDTDKDTKTPGNVIEFYTKRSVPALRRDCGHSDGDAWNREHIWAKSHGFKKEGMHAYTDLHHLRAADKSVNGDRSNYDFKSGGNDHDECEGCRFNKASNTWEPPNAAKGEVARMLFYMDVRYDGDAESKTPDLNLIDKSTKGKKDPTLGYLSDLLQWHCDYPVTDEERARNDRVHSWQGNRNPFIDHPRFVESIWKVSCTKEEGGDSTQREEF